MLHFKMVAENTEFNTSLFMEEVQQYPARRSYGNQQSSQSSQSSDHFLRRSGRARRSFGNQALGNSEMLISSDRVTAEMLISRKGAKILKALVVRVLVN